MATIGGYTKARIEERAVKRGRTAEDQELLDTRSGAAKRRARPGRRRGTVHRKKGATQ